MNYCKKWLIFFCILAISGSCQLQNTYADSVPKDLKKDIYAVPLTATSIPLNYKDMTVTTVGKLHYLGGLKITSSLYRFGGISSLLISPDGSRLLGISDNGEWLVADMIYNQNNHLVDIKNARMAPLKNLKGQTKNWARDAEAVTDVAGAGYVVSFENPQAILYYQARTTSDYDSLFSAFAQKMSFAPDLPKAMLTLPRNLGIEALTTLPDGRILALSESTHRKGDKTYSFGWLIGRGKIESLSFEIDPSYKPTDMATLPNGDILVLERHFSLARGMASRISRIASKTIVAGKIIRGEVIADLAFPLNMDNMEGLAVRKNEAGQTIIYIMSDNNFSRMQRNLLMMFQLDD